MEQSQKQESGAPPANAGTTGKPSFWRRRPVIVICTVVLFVLLFYTLGYLAESLTHESTDDAFLDAHITAIAPKVSGQVKRVYVTDNQAVKAGELLVEIDPRDLQVALDQRQSAVKSALANVDLLKANLELAQAQIGSAAATAKQSTAESAAAQATAERANADLKRAQDLVKKNTISPQEFDTAQAAATAAEANLRAAQEKTVSNQAKVAEAQATVEASRKALDKGEALARQAEWDEKAAELNLSYARLTAPEDGYVTKKAVENGDYLQVGQRIMALVPAKGLYVTANFKETQLQTIRPGQPVKVTIDSAAHGPFAGKVDSIMAGSGARFSLLPPENAVGNYVKVVQRIPVKIVFDDPVEAGHVLGPGMSVVPLVHVTNYVIPEAIVLIVAVVLAIIVGMVWWTAAGKKRTA